MSHLRIFPTVVLLLGLLLTGNPAHGSTGLTFDLHRFNFLSGSWTTKMIKDEVYADLYFSTPKTTSIVGYSRSVYVMHAEFETDVDFYFIHRSKESVSMTMHSQTTGNEAQESRTRELQLGVVTPESVQFLSADGSYRIEFSHHGRELDVKETTLGDNQSKSEIVTHYWRRRH